MEVKIKSVNKENLNGFIKKLLSVDSFIFMTADEKNIKSSVYFPERDAVKLVSVPTSDIFDANFDEPVKISFFDGKKVISYLSHFGAGIEGKIKYEEYDDSMRATDVLLKDDELKINLACTDFSLSFMEMSEDEISRAFDTEDSLFEFDLKYDSISRIKSLCTLDNSDTFTLYKNKNGIGVSGENYSNILVKENSSDNENVVLYKKYLELLDKEDYKVYVCDCKVIFESENTDTKLCIATVAVDDEDED